MRLKRPTRHTVSDHCNPDKIMKPSFLRRLQEAEGIRGSSAHLECLLSGSLPMTIQWYRDEKEIHPDHKHRFRFSDNVALLEIADLSSHDNNRFTCRANNAAGSVQCSATMTVKGSSQLALSRFKHSQNFSLQCY